MDVEIRPTAPGDEEDFVEVLSAAFGHRPSAEHLAEDAADVAGIRGWLALAEGRPVGVGGLIDVRLTLPGGVRLPLAGVTEVGVLPTHRRRVRWVGSRRPQPAIIPQGATTGERVGGA